MISKEHYDKVMTYIQPMIFDKITVKMAVAKEAIFGLVLLVMTVETDGEAIRLANDTEYGLQALVYCADMSTAIKAAKKINAGTVSINCYGEGDITTPFGGYKLSGFGGRDSSLRAFEQYSETKTIWMAING